MLGKGNLKLDIQDKELEKKLLIKNKDNKHVYKIESEAGA